MRAPHPLTFFGDLCWLDGRSVPDVIEPYRRRIFDEALYSFEPDNTPRFNLVLSGRAKKNWKSADLCFAALYRFLAWPSALGNDCFLLANDEGQAADDLTLIKRVLAMSPRVASEVVVRDKYIERKDGMGALEVLPARDVAGAHGKTYLFTGFDEIHGYRNWDLLEALAPDPTRRDALTWITSYASLHHQKGAPLHDLFQAGRKGEDPRMLFTWHAADYCTDPGLEDASPEERANPSMVSWGNPGYLSQQKRRLPTHKYRRLHLNLPGMPEGAFLDVDAVTRCIVEGRRRLPPQEGVRYAGFVDMSGGSSDEACLGIGHRAPGGRLVLDLVESQAGKPPFNPRQAVVKFARLLKRYGLGSVTGDAYAGQTFREDFEAQGITYRVTGRSASELYELLEPRVNAGEVELLDIPVLIEQLLGLVVKGTKVRHLPGEHDDFANVAAGVLVTVGSQVELLPVAPSGPVAPSVWVPGSSMDSFSWGDERIWGREW